jgi:hypothetical protein
LSRLHEVPSRRHGAEAPLGSEVIATVDARQAAAAAPLGRLSVARQAALAARN